jgi:predicted small secreted protein
MIFSGLLLDFGFYKINKKSFRNPNNILNFKKMTKQFLIIAIIAAAFSFASCNKEETNNNDAKQGGMMKSATDNRISMRVFANFDQLTEEVERTFAFSLKELEDHEAKTNFNSFGKLADRAMEPVIIDAEAGKSSSPNLSRSAIQSSEYLQLVAIENDEEACVTKYFQSPYRYIMNTNCMFKVDTFYFKVFEGGHVSCGTAYYNELSKLSETDFSLLEDNDIFSVFKYSDDGKGNHGWSKKTKAEKGTERVNVEVYYVEAMRRMVNGCVKVDAGCFVAKTWGQHRFLGIWWTSNRTHSQNISGRISVNNSLRSGSASGTKSGYRIEQTMVIINDTFPPGVYNPSIFIHSAWGWGKVPAVTCNINWQ